MATTTEEAVQHLYIGLLGRAADAEGLAYWVGEIDAGILTLEQLRSNIVNEQPEYMGGMGQMTRADLVTELYQNLFEREPDAAGLDYWVNGGGSSVNADQLILALVDGASVPDLQVLGNKTTAAQYYTENLGGADTYNADAATASVADVNGSLASLNASIAFTDAGGVNSNLFTITNLPSTSESTLIVGFGVDGNGNQIGGAPADMVLDFLQDVAGLDLLQLGLLDSNGNLIATNIESINVFDNTGDGSDFSISIDLDDGSVIEEIVSDYVGLVSRTLFSSYSQANRDGPTVDTDIEVDQFAVILTPQENNGATFERGLTSAADDLIIAGRPELLQGAYIDGGSGYNTLQVDMKGFFAQPFQLLNIQEVQVQNLENVYEVSQTIIDGANLDFPVPAGGAAESGDSILDLSRASSLERLLITEGFNDGESGGLIVSGIQNYATVRLEGEFDEFVDLYFGAGQGSELTVELANVSFNDTFSVNQNVGVVNVISEGAVNTLDDIDFGGNFIQINVSGTGLLSIEDELEFSFGEATVDASESTGGVRMQLSNLDDFDDLGEVTISGSQVRDVFELNSAAANGVLLNIDTGTGRDTLRLNADISAGDGSVVTGDNLTVEVASNADLREADVSGVDRFLLTADGGLLLGQAQVVELGASVFVAAHNTVPTLSIEVSESGTVLSDLIDLSSLDSDVKLAFNVKAGASLDLTAQQLHNWVAEDGVVGEGLVNLTGVGLGFDVDSAAGAIGDGVGTIDNFDGTLNVVRAADGFERPGAAPDSDVLLIDTTGTGGIEVEANNLPGVADDITAFSTAAETVIIGGPDDITFNAPVEMLASDFTLDFSALGGALNNLTIINFDEVEEVVGNGAADVRINVSIDGDVGAPGTDEGLMSSGVAQYVVVDMNDGEGGPDSHSFHVCDLTMDVEVLGLQGNADETLTFTNVPWGSVNPTILFEGDGFGDWSELPKAAGNPDESNVGTIEAEYFFPGAPASVLITNQGVVPGTTSTGGVRPIVVDGILLENAVSVDITVEDGNAVIEELDGHGDLDDVTLTSANDVTLSIDEDNDDQNIDGSAVAGTMTLLIEDDEDVTLAESTLAGIDAVVMQDDSSLELNIDQVTAIGAANFSVEDFADGDAAELSIGEFADAPFDFTTLTGIDGITVGSVTTAVGTFTADPATDFTGVTSLVIPTGSTYTISATQYQQLVAAGAVITTGPDTLAGTPSNEGSLTVDMEGDLTIGEDDEAVLGGANVTFDAADGETLFVETFALADGLQVSGDAAAATVPLVNFLFNNTDPAFFPITDTIDVSAYDGVDLKIRDSLLDNYVTQSIEDLLDQLASANILNIEATPEIVVVDDARDRVVVVESDAEPDGIEFSAQNAAADYLRTVDLTLEADADGAALIDGDIFVNDGRVEADSFLTINTTDTDGAATGPAIIDGDISTDGAEAGDEGEFLTLTINAAVDLDITGDVTFSSIGGDPVAATVTITGDADVTIKELIAGTDVTTVNVVTTGYTGTFTQTGGSPALSGELETLNYDGDGTVLVGTPSAAVEAESTADDGTSYSWGAVTPDLSTVNAADQAGDLTAIFGSVDSDEFTFTGGTGVNTLWLSEVVTNADQNMDGEITQVNATTAPTLDATGTWTVDMTAAAAGSALRITDAVDLSAGGTLALDLGDAQLQIGGNVDFRDLDELTFGAGAPVIFLEEGATVRMTDEQFEAFEAAGGTIEGPGTTLLLDAEKAGELGGDLLDVRGVDEVQLVVQDDDTEYVGPARPVTADILLTVEQAALTTQFFYDEDGVLAALTVDDAGVFDEDGDPAAAGDFRATAGDVTVDVGADADVTDLQGVTTFDLTPASDTFLAITVRPDQLAKIEVDGAMATAAQQLDVLSSLTVSVDVDSGNTDTVGNPIIELREFAFEVTRDDDDMIESIDVTGNAAAISQAEGDAADYLLEADSVTWNAVGTTATATVQGPLTAVDDGFGEVINTFVWIANPDDQDSGTQINGFTPGDAAAFGDVSDFTAFLGDGYTAFNDGSTPVTFTSGNDELVVGQVAFWELNDLLDGDFGAGPGDDFADFDGQAVIVGGNGNIWYVDSTGGGDVASVDNADDIVLVGNLATNVGALVDYNVGA